MAVKPVPDGYHTLTPIVVVRDAPAFIAFLKHAFGARELDRLAMPDGTIMHAEVRIGDSILMLGQEREDSTAWPGMFNLYVPDVDRVFSQALQAGAASLREPADQFYGDRTGGLLDPFGNQWWISTHVEDVPREQLEERMLASAGS